MFEQLEFWHWIVLAVALLILELAGTAGFLLMIASAAFAVGVIVALIPGLDWQWQLFLFSVFSILSSYIWWRRMKGQTNDAASSLNSRSEQLVGRVTVITEAIVNGRGKIKIDDSNWYVMGEDYPEGTKVKVSEAVDASLLKVIKVD